MCGVPLSFIPPGPLSAPTAHHILLLGTAVVATALITCIHAIRLSSCVIQDVIWGGFYLTNKIGFRSGNSESCKDKRSKKTCNRMYGKPSNAVENNSNAFAVNLP